MNEVSGKYPEMEFELVDLKELDLPWFTSATSPSMANKQYTDPKVQEWSKMVDAADAFIIVNPEYNHGYTAPLKNALDHLYPEWNNKPVAFVSYGGMVGGSRAVQMLRQVAIELQMAPIREGIHIPFIWSALDENGNPKDPIYAQSIEKKIKQLQWWADALKVARGKE
jgi:NAD(P)H-dependent FMN reductase